MDKNEVEYQIMQAMYSPRDGQWGYRMFDSASTLDQAKRIAKQLRNAKVLKTQVVYTVGCE